MHTLIVIAGGLVALAVFVIAAVLSGARRPQVRAFSFCRGWPLRFSISISARSTATPS
jgi:hypothetical protein